MDLRDDARNYSDTGLQVQELLQEACQHVPDSDAGVVCRGERVPIGGPFMTHAKPGER